MESLIALLHILPSRLCLAASWCTYIAQSLCLSTWLQESTCVAVESEHLHFEMIRPSFLRTNLFKAVAQFMRETKNHRSLCRNVRMNLKMFVWLWFGMALLSAEYAYHDKFDAQLIA